MILSDFHCFLNEFVPKKHIPVLIPTLFPRGIKPEQGHIYYIYIYELHARKLYGLVSSIFQP